MRPKTFIPLLATACLLLVPVASAEVAGEALLNFESPAAADIEFDLTISGEDAQETRAAIDSDQAGGNGDGDVSQEEADAFEELLRSSFNRPGATPASGMTIDGQNASASNLTSFDILDATGDVNSTEPIRYDLVMAIEWPVTPGDEHTFESSGDEDADGESQGDVSLTIRAPSGYTISSTDGLPDGADVSDDEVTYDAAEGQATGTITVVFSQSSGAFGGAPAVGALLLLVVVFGLVVASRHRP